MFDFRITPDGKEPYDLTADSRDVAAWERITKSSLSSLQTSFRINDMYDIAHQAARRQGLFGGNRSEFEEGHVLEMRDDDDVDPTNAAPSTAP